MRIVHIITRLIVGGAQENTVLNCRDLIQEFDDDVTLVTGPTIGPEGSLLESAREAGIPIKVIDSLRRAIHPVRDLVAYRELKRIIRVLEPDVVHTHSAKGGMLGRYAASACKVPFVVHTVHGAPFHNYQSPTARGFFRSCERRAAGRCHHYVSVADAMTDLMVTAGVAPRERFTTIYSGMEVEPFLFADAQREATRRELGYRPDQIVIGKIARLFHLKGHDDFLTAAKQVAAQVPQARFLLVGDGILRQDLERRIADAGLSEQFHITGLVPPERIPALLAATDVVVHTSLREGLARVLPQALLVGRPVISYDIDGAREVVIPDATGELLEAGDVMGLAAAQVELAGDAALRQRYGQEGRRRFAEQFSHQRMTREIRALYKRGLRQDH